LSGPGVLHTWPDRKFVKHVENRYDARLEGVLVYDRVRERITRWDLAALGDSTGRWFPGTNGWQEATSAALMLVGFAAQVYQSAYQLGPERRRPSSFVHAYTFRDREEHYWDPDRWLEDWKKRQRK